MFASAWSHHIPRLMVLANIASLPEVVMSALRRRPAAQKREDARMCEKLPERLIRGERIDQPRLV